MALDATVKLLNTIPELVLTGSPVPLRFEASENLIETEGSAAEIVLTWTANANAGEYFDLLLAGETVRFTCAAAPDNSGVQFHDNSLGATLISWVSLVAADLRKNYLIAKHYTVTVVGAGITITANEPGSAYSQEFTAGAGIDVTPDETDKTGVDRALRAFYAIAILLYCNDEFVTELNLNVDADGIAEADISKLLSAYVNSEFSFPESDADFIFARTGNVKTWYFIYGERWGSGTYTAMQQSSVYFAMLGGLSWIQMAKYNADSSSFWDKLNYNKYFLSWAPLTRYISPTEPVKIYYLNYSGATTLNVKAKLYTASTDSTVDVDTIASTDMTVYEIILSPDKVDYTGISDETLVMMEVWAENESGVRVSEIRSYVMDYAHYEHERYFLFLNSLGAYEVIRSTGIMSRADNYERETATTGIESDYTAKNRGEVSVLNREQQRFNIALGWLSRYGDGEEFRNWLRDFAVSKEVYMISGNTIKPIRLTGTSFDRGADRDMLRKFAFEFVNAWTDDHFTKEITGNLYAEDFSSDFEIAQ